MNQPESSNLMNMLGYTVMGTVANETIIGTADADSLVGGTGNDTISGGAGDDTIRGGAGMDFLTGGAGDDFLYGGKDNDIIRGGIGNDVLNGGEGADSLLGCAGSDTYYVDDAGDVVVENANEGTDTVIYSADFYIYTLGENIENLILAETGRGYGIGYGNSLNNVIIGNSDDNILDGKECADTMIGGTGNDTYYVDNSGDVIIENADEGIDSVISSISYTLGDNFENLSLEGGISPESDAPIYGIGNDLDNYISGSSVNNILIGGAGSDTLNSWNGGQDTLIGGTENDFYHIGWDGLNDDIIIENVNEGIDTVRSFVSYTLTDNVENLILDRFYSGNANGTGNNLNNVITGSLGDNIISGLSGNDTLDGVIGFDTLIGGAGDDTYIVNSYNPSELIKVECDDTVIDSEGNDQIIFGSNVAKGNVAVFMSGTDLVVDYGAIIGQDKIVILGQTNSNNAIEKLQLSDGTYISNTDVNQLIQTMTSYAAANGIQLTNVNDVKNNQDLMTMVATSWHS